MDNPPRFGAADSGNCPRLQLLARVALVAFIVLAEALSFAISHAHAGDTAFDVAGQYGFGQSHVMNFEMSSKGTGVVASGGLLSCAFQHT